MKLNPLQLAILYLFTYNIGEIAGIPGGPTYRRAQDTIDGILRENGMPDSEHVVYDPDGCPINVGDDVELEWVQNIGRALGKDFELSYWGKALETFLKYDPEHNGNPDNLWDKDILLQALADFNENQPARGIDRESPEFDEASDFGNLGEMDMDAQDVGLKPFYLSEQQQRVIALLIHTNPGDDGDGAVEEIEYLLDVRLVHGEDQEPYFEAITELRGIFDKWEEPQEPEEDEDDNMDSDYHVDQP